MSLTTCLKKAGTALHPEDKAAILAESRRLRGTGMGADEAGRAAVLAQFSAVNARLREASPVTPEEVAAAFPPAEPAKIEDVGEKIGGARKDRWKDRGLDVSDLDAMSESEGATLATKANVWKPDYAAIAETSEPVTAAMVKVVYDSLAAKPKQDTPQGRRDYVAAMQAVRKVYGAVTSPEQAKEAYQALREELGLRERVGDGSGFREVVGQAAADAKRVLFSVYKGRSDPFVFGYNELARARKLVQDGFPGAVEPWTRRFYIRTTGGSGTTTRGLDIYEKQAADAGTPLTREQILAGAFEVRTKDGKTAAYGATREDAEAAAKAAYERTKGRGDGKAEPDRPHLDKIERAGLPQRIDRDVTAETLLSDFGFRGVEFGNWAAQDERRKVLALAYDALADLSEILGVPTKALSLNGTMGIAFGARGGGSFAAHYEPGKLVINMTKLRGAGSLAHEWAHAADHYLGELGRADAYQGMARGASGWRGQERYDGQPRKRMVQREGKWVNEESMRLENLRPELAQQVDAVMRRLYETPIPQAEALDIARKEVDRYRAMATGEGDARFKAMYAESAKRAEQLVADLEAGKPSDRMKRSAFAAEAQKLSGKSSDGYWLRPTEMFARAFESYVFDRLMAMGAQSEYLVHGVEQDRFADGTRFKGNPYPTGEERAAINDQFSKLFDTIKTREDDAGNVAMFSRALQDDNADSQGEDYGAGFWRQLGRLRETLDGTGLPAAILGRTSRRSGIYGGTRPDGITTGLGPVVFEDEIGGGRRFVSIAEAGPAGGGQGLTMYVIPFDAAQSAAAEDRANPVWRERNSVLSIGITGERGFGYNLSISTLNPGDPAFDSVPAGTYTPTGQRDAFGREYFRLRMGGAAAMDYMSEAVRRFGLHYGFAPDVTYTRETGANPGGAPHTASADRVMAKFSREGASGLTRDQAEPIAAAIRQALPGSPPIHLHDSVADAPASLRAEIERAGAQNDVEAAYHQGEIHVFPANIASPERMAFVVGRHEVRHHGLRAILGDKLGTTMLRMWRENPALRAAAQKVMDAGHAMSRPQAIEEALADMPTADIERLSGFDRIVSAVRGWLRRMAEKLGLPGVKWTDRDVAAMVSRAEDVSRSGGEGTAFSRSAQTSTEAFKRWFGSSKVVDAEGRPLVVYHGTRNDITTFDAGKVNGRFPNSEGFYFTSKPLHASVYADSINNAAEDFNPNSRFIKPVAEGGNVMPAYVSLQNPKTLTVSAWGTLESRVDGDGGAQVRAAREAGHDGVIVKREAGDEWDGMLVIAFRPEQIKSAIGNSGTFDTSNPDIRFSRAPTSAAAARAGMANALRGLSDAKLPAGYILNDFLDSPGTLSWWHKSVGTMHNLAERSPLFKPVYDSATKFLNAVSAYATEAADLAPELLPKLDGLRDIGRSPLSAQDTKAIAAPIFEGTLSWARAEDGAPVRESDPQAAGIVWSDDELRKQFNLNDKQIGLYREFRKATDKSLTDLAVSDMLRFAGKGARDIAGRVMAAGDVHQAAEILSEHLTNAMDADPDRAGVLADTISTIGDKADRAQSLIDRGYAPLSRFGRYVVDVVDKGERVFFNLYETQFEANRAARKMAESYPEATVSRGTTSQQAYQMFAGISPETMELFGDLLGIEADGNSAASQAFQQYLKMAKSTRSAMKRLIERKGIAGFSEDAGRVLAGFIYSNARQTAKNLHLGELGESVAAIRDTKGEGELLDAAERLRQYVTNPVEEAQKIKSLLFAQFLGGSLAAGMVNLSQTVMVTFPWLTQYGGVKKAAAQMKAALVDAVKWETAKGKPTTGDAKLDAALKAAEEDGTVSPQEVHALIAQAGGGGSLRAGDGTAAGNAYAKGQNFLSKVMLGWGRPFALAEQFNRRATFIAAYRTAIDQGMEDPAAFARRAVEETQFAYTKANRPEWARGAIGSLLFTFKTFSISYVELLARMAQSGPDGRRAAAVGLATLFLMSGLNGLPGSDDLDDLIDGLMQRLGYNWSTKREKRQLIANILGEGGAKFAMSGLSGLPGVPIDVAGRLGLGNLIPGTGLLTKKADHGQDVAELFGAAGSFGTQVLTAAGQAAEGNAKEAAAALLPVALQNLAKAYDMASTGMYRDQKGRKVLDVDGYDAAFKAIGFQPNDVATVQRTTREVQGEIALAKLRETEIADKWAQGIFTQDADAVADARKELVRWNDNNPASRIVIQPAQLLKRLREMRESKTERLAKTAPREMRAMVRQELSGAQ